MTLIKALQLYTPHLRPIAGDLAAKEFYILLEQILKRERAQIISQPQRILSGKEAEQLEVLVKRRTQGEPISKIMGHKEFWSLPFKVTIDTLDPRPESELILETILSYFPDKDKSYKILDLGAGTGCLILSLLSELPNSRGVGIDKSEPALTVARDNAINLGLEQRIQLIES